MEMVRVNVYWRDSKAKFYLKSVDPRCGKRLKEKAAKSELAGQDTEAGYRAALEEAIAWEKELAAQANAPIPGTPWNVFLRAWLDHGTSHMRPSTIKKYKGVLQQFHRAVGCETVNDLSLAKVNQFRVLRRRSDVKESTLSSDIRHISAFAKWAKKFGYIHGDIDFSEPKSARVKSAMRKSKGRAVRPDEMERMVAAIPKVILTRGQSATLASTDFSRVPSWEFLTKGLYLSGLRIAEAYELRWDRDAKGILVDIQSNREAYFHFPGELQKNGKHEVIPMAPDFARFLLEHVPVAERHGFVFNPRSSDKTKTERLSVAIWSRTIGSFGRHAGIVVSAPGEPEKYASAHDLRRSFGTRWAEQGLEPIKLKELMRHSAISTTMDYYVGLDAKKLCQDLNELLVKSERVTSE